MTGSTINDLMQILNASDTILRYNSIIENDITQNGGTVLYSFNNIIIASEISEIFFKSLQNNTYIEYINSLPLKKYGDVNTNLINQLDISNLFLGGGGPSWLVGSLVLF